MAPTVLLEYTKEKQMKKSSKDLSFAMIGKPQRLSQGYCFGSVPNYQHGSDVMHELEGFSSPVRADTEDSCAPKRSKRINLDVDRCNGFNIPVQLISLSKMSGSKREELKMRLRSELEQIQMFQKKLYARNITAGDIATSSSINGNDKKHETTRRSSSQMKRGISGRFESSKTAAPPPPTSNSNLALMKHCETLLKRLMSHQYGWVFNSPVDVVKLNIPDYYTVIKHPMDLGTIKAKITLGAYSSPWGFAADVRLTFTNAMTYNPPGNDVHIMADTLSKFFETRWKPIDKKLAATDAPVKRETEGPKSQLSSEKRKTPPTGGNNLLPETRKPKMTDEEKQSLTSRLEPLLEDLPDHIIDFLRLHSGNTNQSSEEVEIDIDSLGDETLFELRKLLDCYLQEREMREQVTEQCKMEANENGVSTSSAYSCKGNDLADEDVDICGDDPPMSSYPTLEIDKGTKIRDIKGSSSSSSSADSGSSSNSDYSTGSESDKQVSIPKNAAKENSGTKAGSYQENSDIMDPLDVNRALSGLNGAEKDAHPKPSLVEADGCQEGEHAPSERQVSPEKLYRAALLRSRFADTILKAREKTLGQGEKGDPEKLRRQREKIEQQQREDRARLQAEAKAVEDARRQAEAEAAAEAKRKREIEREAARQSLLQMEKTVEINEDSQILKDLEMLRTVPAEQIPMPLDEKCPGYSLDGIGGFTLGGSNPLEQLGLFMKVDDEEEDEGEPRNAAVTDFEEGEID